MPSYVVLTFEPGTLYAPPQTELNQKKKSPPPHRIKQQQQQQEAKGFIPLAGGIDPNYQGGIGLLLHNGARRSATHGVLWGRLLVLPHPKAMVNEKPWQPKQAGHLEDSHRLGTMACQSTLAS